MRQVRERSSRTWVWSGWSPQSAPKIGRPCPGLTVITALALAACGGVTSASLVDAGARDEQASDATAVGDSGSDAAARQDSSGEPPDASCPMCAPEAGAAPPNCAAPPYSTFVCAGGLCGTFSYYCPTCGENGITCDCGACSNPDDLCGDNGRMNRCGHVCMALEPPDSGKAAVLCGCTMSGAHCPFVPTWVVSEGCFLFPWFGFGSNTVYDYVTGGLGTCFTSTTGYTCCP